MVASRATTVISQFESVTSNLSRDSGGDYSMSQPIMIIMMTYQHYHDDSDSLLTVVPSQHGEGYSSLLHYHPVGRRRNTVFHFKQAHWQCRYKYQRACCSNTTPNRQAQKPRGNAHCNSTGTSSADDEIHVRQCAPYIPSRLQSRHPNAT